MSISSKEVDNICFYGTSGDKSYLSYLKPLMGGATVFLRLETVSTLMEVKMYCKKIHATRIISTSVPLLSRLLDWKEQAAPKINNYAGSIFTIDNDGEKLEILFIPPLKQLVTVTYGKFLAKRYISKFTKPDSWFPKVPFSWTVARPENMEQEYDLLKTAFLVAIDIETFRENAQIRCISFCGFYYTKDGIEARAVVIPLESTFMLAWMRKLCWNLQAPKVFQNGKYDNAYLLRYNSPVFNWVYDTANMQHSWYSELPKDLGSLNAFYVRDAMYWKDLAKTTDLQEYYHYNALDTFSTGVCCLAWLLEAPKWAKDNYILEFPVVYPCLLGEMIGIKRDMDKLDIVASKEKQEVERMTSSLRKILGVPHFNPGSPKQVVSVLKLLGCKDITSSGEKELKKAMYRHPFNARILGMVINIRKINKRLSNYLITGEKAKEFKGRVLYTLVPHGTDTSRLASGEHHFWCGFNIQNQPRGKIIKQTYVADEGFYFAEIDLAQAESRDTAYISGDESLIDSVENSPDFHKANASKFFGVPFEEITKQLRQLGKPVNHGANYNMGAYVLIDTMGLENIYKAKALLGLPKIWTVREVAEHLLDLFHKAYPKIRGTMYKGIVNEIHSTHMLKSKAIHYSDNITPFEEQLEHYPTWTRYCFGDPDKSKMILNSYVAHPPQSLNAQTLNKAYLRVFKELVLNPEHSDNFKLCAQVHDSILTQYRIGQEYILEEIRKRMEIPITIKAYDNKIRTFTVPADIKAGVDGKPARYWSETE